MQESQEQGLAPLHSTYCTKSAILIAMNKKGNGGVLLLLKERRHFEVTRIHHKMGASCTLRIVLFVSPIIPIHCFCTCFLSCCYAAKFNAGPRLDSHGESLKRCIESPNNASNRAMLPSYILNLAQHVFPCNRSEEECAGWDGCFQRHLLWIKSLGLCCSALLMVKRMPQCFGTASLQVSNNALSTTKAAKNKRND